MGVEVKVEPLFELNLTRRKPSDVELDLMALRSKVTVCWGTKSINSNVDEFTEGVNAILAVFRESDFIAVAILEGDTRLSVVLVPACQAAVV
jgi:hypothetical protein